MWPWSGGGFAPSQCTVGLGRLPLRDCSCAQDTGDSPSDIYFDLRGVSLPLECAYNSRDFNCKNPEQNGTDLVVAKVVLEVDTDAIGEYARCNTDGKALPILHARISTTAHTTLLAGHLHL